MLQGREVLVTGGTGFLGGRLVEKLVLEHDARIRVLVRDFSRAARIARFPIQMIHGDITDRDAVQKAVEGCEFIFHCAYDFAGDARHRRAVSVEGTENVAEASLSTGVARVVHVSSVSVYGTPDGDLDETCPRSKTRDMYADTKLGAETVMFGYHRERGLPVAIVQPTIIYGPFSRPWTIGIVNQLRNGPVALPADAGLCNAVYIDDVVDGMILAALNDDAIGESLLISGDEPVSWIEFFREYERILGTQSVVVLSADELAHLSGRAGNSWRSSPLWRQWRRVLANPDVRIALVETPIVNWPYRLAKRFVPGRWTALRARYFDQPGSSPAPIIGAGSDRSPQARSVPQTDPLRLALYLAKTRVRIDKARRVLGYQPAFDFGRGMTLTEQFVKWYFSL